MDIPPSVSGASEPMKIKFPLYAAAITAGVLIVGSVGASSAEAKVTSSSFASLGAAAKPAASVTDAAGNLFTLNEGDNTISKITPAGTVTRVFSSLGAGVSPQGMTIDPLGNLYVSCAGTDSVTRVSPSGATIKYWSYDGVGSMPRGITSDAGGNVFVANYADSTIMKIAATGAVYPAFARLDPTDYTYGLATDASGNIYAADTATDRISKISATGAVTEAFAQLPKDAHPVYVAVDSHGDVYSANSAGNVAKFASDGSVIDTNIMSAPGPSKPDNLMLDPYGDLFIADEFTNQITAVDPNGGDAGIIASLPTGSLARAEAISGSIVYAPDYITGDIQRSDLRPAMSTAGLNTSIRRASRTSMAVTADGFEPLYAVSMGSLPPGLDLDAQTGRISGSPTTVGTYTFDILTMNHWGGSSPQHEVITVTP
jgi:streptogramin lyase